MVTSNLMKNARSHRVWCLKIAFSKRYKRLTSEQMGLNQFGQSLKQTMPLARESRENIFMKNNTSIPDSEHKQQLHIKALTISCLLLAAYRCCLRTQDVIRLKTSLQYLKGTRGGMYITDENGVGRSLQIRHQPERAVY